MIPISSNWIFIAKTCARPYLNYKKNKWDVEAFSMKSRVLLVLLEARVKGFFFVLSRKSNAWCTGHLRVWFTRQSNVVNFQSLEVWLCTCDIIRFWQDHPSLSKPSEYNRRSMPNMSLSAHTLNFDQAYSQNLPTSKHLSYSRMISLHRAGLL